MERMFEVQMKKDELKRQEKIAFEEVLKQREQRNKSKDTSFGMVTNGDGTVTITVGDIVVTAEEARKLIGDEQFEMAMRLMS